MLRTIRGGEVLYGCAQEVCGRGLRVRAILVPHGGVFGRRRASPAGGRRGGHNDALEFGPHTNYMGS